MGLFWSRGTRFGVWWDWHQEPSEVRAAGDLFWWVSGFAVQRACSTLEASWLWESSIRTSGPLALPDLQRAQNPPDQMDALCLSHAVCPDSLLLTSGSIQSMEPDSHLDPWLTPLAAYISALHVPDQTCILLHRHACKWLWTLIWGVFLFLTRIIHHFIILSVWQQLYLFLNSSWFWEGLLNKIVL